MESAKDGRRASDSMMREKLFQKIAECFDGVFRRRRTTILRHWWDFAVVGNGRSFYPVNLKVSKFGGCQRQLELQIAEYTTRLREELPDFAQ